MIKACSTQAASCDMCASSKVCTSCTGGDSSYGGDCMGTCPSGTTASSLVCSGKPNI